MGKRTRGVRASRQGLREAKAARMASATSWGASRGLPRHADSPPPEAYAAAVEELRAMSIVPPGRERPTKPCPVWSTSARQESAMDPNVPQPLAATREITRDMRAVSYTHLTLPTN